MKASGRAAEAFVARTALIDPKRLRAYLHDGSPLTPAETRRFRAAMKAMHAEYVENLMGGTRENVRD